MNSFQFALAIGLAGVLFIDSIGAWASRLLKFRYTVLLYPQIAVWAATGALAAAGATSHFRALSLAVAAGAIVGFVDASLGWWISAKIGPGRPRLADGSAPSKVQVAQMAAGAIIFAISTACLGGVLSRLLSALA